MKRIGEKPAGVSKEELTERLLDEAALALDESDRLARAAVSALRAGAVAKAVADLEVAVASAERSRVYAAMAQSARLLPYDDASAIDAERAALAARRPRGDGRVERALRAHFDPPIFGWPPDAKLKHGSGSLDRTRRP